MLTINNKTIGDVFTDAVKMWPDEIFFISPKTAERPEFQLSYSEAQIQVNLFKGKLLAAGYGLGERIALLLGNRVDHYLIKLAANNLGISVVPLNPDLSPYEIIYILNDSQARVTITDNNHLSLISLIKQILSKNNFFYNIDDNSQFLPTNQRTINNGEVYPQSEASLLYTSGTTGNPKGCILSHEYELMCGDSYRSIKPPVGLRINNDRIFNPLPSFHINAGIVTFFGSVLTGNCLIQPMRFSTSTWWQDIEETQATIFHYLGVVIALILKTIKETDRDLSSLRYGLGAGVEPTLHKEFEQAFRIPLIEVWGMTEMCRIITASEEPRLIDTRAMGRPRSDLEVKVIDANEEEVAIGTQGEMVVRYSAATPRKGAFSGYLGDTEATEFAWRGGWFHTGDTVRMDKSRMLYFVDRKKNIIRRAGENIAAAEVEACILEHKRVLAVACIAIPDELREEEILACIVLSNKRLRLKRSAETLFRHVFDRLAYFKAPGWILFVDKLPTTGTQKVLKHKIFAKNEDPRKRKDIFDLRVLKIRKNQKLTIK